MCLCTILPFGGEGNARAPQCPVKMGDGMDPTSSWRGVMWGLEWAWGMEPRVGWVWGA